VEAVVSNFLQHRAGFRDPQSQRFAFEEGMFGDDPDREEWRWSIVIRFPDAVVNVRVFHRIACLAIGWIHKDFANSFDFSFSLLDMGLISSSFLASNCTGFSDFFD
jgi:hypothetical protein